MQLDLSGKTALVTGSSNGIGWAIAQTLHAEGCRVALNARNAADLTHVCRPSKKPFTHQQDTIIKFREWHYICVLLGDTAPRGSAASGYMNGQNMVMDGGRSTW